MFYRKDGKLTAYAFACGYVERVYAFKIYKDGVYHLQNEITGLWDSFATIQEARQQLAIYLKGTK
jgi:hypothetical protein